MKEKTEGNSKASKVDNIPQLYRWKLRIVIWLTIPLSILTSYLVYYSIGSTLSSELVNELVFRNIDGFLLLVFFFTFVSSLFRIRMKSRFVYEISDQPNGSSKIQFRRNGLEIRFIISLLLFFVYYLISKLYGDITMLLILEIIFTALVYGILSTYMTSRVMMIPLKLMLHPKQKFGTSILIGGTVILAIGSVLLFGSFNGKASNFTYYLGEIDTIEVEAFGPMEMGTELPSDFNAVITYTNGKTRTISSDELTLSEYNKFKLDYEYVEFEYKDYKSGFSINYYADDVYVVNTDQQLNNLEFVTGYTSLYLDLNSNIVVSGIEIPEQFSDIYIVGDDMMNSLVDIEILNSNFNLYISEVNMTGTINSYGRGNKTIEFYNKNHIAGSIEIESIVEIELTEDSYTTIRGIYERETFIGDTITISGKGTLNIYGSHGINGTHGTETSKDGTDGTDGYTAIVAKEQLILNSYRIEFAGGLGGYGGNGYSYDDFDNSTTTTRSGGDGGNGGNTAVAMEACSVSWVYEPKIFLDSGARGGLGGDKGNNVSSDGSDGVRGILNEVIYIPGSSYCN